MSLEAHGFIGKVVKEIKLAEEHSDEILFITECNEPWIQVFEISGLDVVEVFDEVVFHGLFLVLLFIVDSSGVCLEFAAVVVDEVVFSFFMVLLGIGLAGVSYSLVDVLWFR